MHRSSVNWRLRAFSAQLRRTMLLEFVRLAPRRLPTKTEYACPLLAHSGHPLVALHMSAIGPKQTSVVAPHMSAEHRAWLRYLCNLDHKSIQHTVRHTELALRDSRVFFETRAVLIRRSRVREPVVGIPDMAEIGTARK